MKTTLCHFECTWYTVIYIAHILEKLLQQLILCIMNYCGMPRNDYMYLY